MESATMEDLVEAFVSQVSEPNAGFTSFSVFFHEALR